MKKAVNLANDINRKKVGRKYTTTTSPPPTATTIPSPSTTIVYQSAINSTLPNHSRYCSVCDESSLNNNEATFTTIPTINFAICQGSTDRQRRVHFTQAFRRKIYLNRLGLKNKKIISIYIFAINMKYIVSYSI
jgi:hypothetical protein